jgi:hypothetical protein
LFETDADAVSFLQVTRAGEHLYIEPRALPDAAVADLARRAREAMIAGGHGERAAGDSSSSRWLGSGGSKLLLITGASPVAAAEPMRFARFAIEWLAGSGSSGEAQPSEDVARTAPGVAWAEMGADGRLRVLASEQHQERPSTDELGRLLPGQLVTWIAEAAPGGEKRARLVDVRMSEESGTPTAEVRLMWEGNELRGVGHGHRTLVGRHLAAARAAIDALKPLVHGLMHVENLQVSTMQSDAEVVLVSVLVGDERLVGVTLVTEEDEERSGAKAVLDAMNRRLVQLAGQSGQI